METLILTNGTFSTVNESQCSVRSEASTICHSDNVPSLEGLIESSVDSEYFNPRCSDYSDSDAEGSQINEDYFNFSNPYKAESVDFDQITRNFNEVEYWQLPQFEAPNMEISSEPFASPNYCDNNIVHNSIGHLPCETQNIAVEQQARTQHCDNTNYNYVAHATIDLSNMENSRVSNMQMQEVLEQNCDNQNDVSLAESLDNEANINTTDISVNGLEGQNNLDTLQNFILEDFHKVTYVRRKVDKQLNSCYVNIHIEKILPELAENVDNVLEEQINFDEENFNILNFCDAPGGIETSIEEDTKEIDIGMTAKQEPFTTDIAITNSSNKLEEQFECKQEPCSADISIKSSNSQIGQQFQCKQEIVPEIQVKVEPFDPIRSQVMTKYDGETSTNQNSRKQHIAFIPKVAGRKKIDMQARKYIVDDDEENIDVETVTKGDNPVIEARDVDALLAQFEATQFKESKIDKQSSSKQKMPKVKMEKHGKKLKNSMKRDKKVKDIVSKHSKNNIHKEDREKCKDSKGVLENKSKHEQKNSFHQDLKQEGLQFKEKKQSSRSPPTTNNSHCMKSDEQMKSQSRRSADSLAAMKDSTRPDPKNKLKEKHSTPKNIQETQQKSVHPKVSTSTSCSKEKAIGEIPKDLIGRIKEAAKPRQIKLLDTCPFLTDPVIDKRKNRLKSRTAANSSNPKKSNTNKSVSCGTSMSDKSVSNVSQTSTLVMSRHSTSLIESRCTTTSSGQSTSCLASRHTTNPIGSRPINLLPQSNSLGNSSVASRHHTSLSKHISSVESKPCTGSASWQINNNSVTSKMAISESVLSGPPSNNVNGSKVSNYSSAQPTHIMKNSVSMRPVVKISPKDMRISRLTTNTSDASTATDTQEEENDKFWHAVNLDHSYFKSVVQKNNSSVTSINADSKSDQSKEQKIEDSNKSNKPKKKIINWEDYISQKRDKFKSRSSCSSPGSDNGSKTMNQEDWIKKMALDVELLTQESSAKTEQPIPASEIPVRPSVPGIICMETYDVSVNACVAEESALLHMETLEEIKPLLEKSNVKIDQSSLISCLTNSVPNNMPTNKNRREEEVVRLNKVIRHLKADRVKPKVCSVGVQTNISLIKKKSPKRSISISSSSSSDDESCKSWDSRYSRHSRKRSRCSRSLYRSRGSMSRSTSPLRLDNPNIELPRMFRSKEENEEFKRDAELRRILFLGEIEDYIDENFLYKTFERYGEIKTIKIYNRRTKRIKRTGSSESESFAFITFTDSTGACDAMKYYKEDYPRGEKFIMCFGGRREFCKEQYSDLDNMPANFQYEKPYYDRKEVLSFDSMLEEYKKRRSLPST